MLFTVIQLTDNYICQLLPYYTQFAIIKPNITQTQYLDEMTVDEMPAIEMPMPVNEMTVNEMTLNEMTLNEMTLKK